MAMPNSDDARAFYRCAYLRRLEASILDKAGQPTGAVYLAGYVVELMLKALIVEGRPSTSRADAVAELKGMGHNLTRLTETYRREGGSRPPREVALALGLVGDAWDPAMRYNPRLVPASFANRFLKAVDAIYSWADGRT